MLAPVIDAEVAQTVTSLLRRLGLPAFGTLIRIVSLLVTVETGDMAQIFASSTGSIGRVFTGGRNCGIFSSPLMLAGNVDVGSASTSETTLAPGWGPFRRARLEDPKSMRAEAS